MKSCTRCGIAKPLSGFATRRKGSATQQSWCRDCYKAVAATRYRQLTSAQIARKNETTRNRKRDARRRLWAHLASECCVDCGERDVLVLDFDHRVAKQANVADLISNGAPWEAISAEMAKCEVRCANCHRRQTVARRMTAPKRAARRQTGQTRQGRNGAKTSHTVPLLAAGDLAMGDRVTCKRCQRDVRRAEFAWRSVARGIRQPWCRSCHNAQKRKHYSLNRSREVARVSARRRRLLAENAPRLRRYLETHPCADCGETDPVVLEFDHLRDKRADVTRMLWNGVRWAEIELEIAKCEIRCANCHRRRTARQRGFDQGKRGLVGVPAKASGVTPSADASE